MKTKVESKNETVDSPLIKARLAGVFWLLTVLASITALLLISGLIIPHDPANTMTNVVVNETLFRTGIAANLLATACYLGATVLVFELLNPVSKTVSLLAALFSLLGCAVGVVGSFFALTPFIFLPSHQGFSAINPAQLNELAFVFIKILELANNIGLVFFGLHVLLVGFLILKSRFFPRFVGVLMVIGGLGWLTFLFPSVSSYLGPFAMLPGALGELSFTFWLLLKGINVEAWKEKAGFATH